MIRDEIFGAVTAAVTQIQTLSQRDLPPLLGTTRLIGDVPGCDSLVAVEVSIVLTEILAPALRGREIPDSILQGAGRHLRPTLDEITEAVGIFICQGKGPKGLKAGSKDAPAAKAEVDSGLAAAAEVEIAADPPSPKVSTDSAIDQSLSQSAGDHENDDPILPGDEFCHG